MIVNFEDNLDKFDGLTDAEKKEYKAKNRDLILNYFVDKIYLYDDRLVIIGKYEEDSGGTEYMLGPSLKSKDKKVRPHRTSLHGSP